MVLALTKLHVLLISIVWLVLSTGIYIQAIIHMNVKCEGESGVGLFVLFVLFCVWCFALGFCLFIFLILVVIYCQSSRK